MRALLEALKARAIDQLTAVNGERAVHLLADEDALPETTPFPCVGFKDGPVVNEYNIGLNEPKKRLVVEIVGYVQINEPESVIIGKNMDPGILDLMADVLAVFSHWSPQNYTWMNGQVPETGSTYMIAQDKLVQKKKMTMTWTKRAE